MGLPREELKEEVELLLEVITSEKAAIRGVTKTGNLSHFNGKRPSTHFSRDHVTFTYVTCAPIVIASPYKCDS